MNNKSRIALAIAAALGTAAMGASAQTSSVQIGGGLNMFYQYSNPGGPGRTGATASPGGAKHDNLSLSEPEIWVHGEEKLSGDMTFWFRCTSSMDLMGVCAANNDSAQWCGRNSGMGFKGSWGNAFAGTWDTPHKMVSSEARGWWGGTGSLTGGFANMLFNGSGSNTVNTGATFYERRSRSINYHSPSWSGFNIKASTSASNEQTAQNTALLQTLNPRTWALSGEYNNGPLYLGVAYEGHKDFNPSGAVVGNGLATGYNGGTDTSWVFAARYTFGFGTRLSGLYSRSKYDVTNTTEVKKNGFALFVDHQLSGPHSIKAQYYKVGDSKGSNLGTITPTALGPVLTGTSLGSIRPAATETGGYGWALAYMYQFSKRTEMGFVYGRLHNDLFASYSRGVSTPAQGESVTSYGLNVRHKF